MAAVTLAVALLAAAGLRTVRASCTYTTTGTTYAWVDPVSEGHTRLGISGSDDASVSLTPLPFDSFYFCANTSTIYVRAPCAPHALQWLMRAFDGHRRAPTGGLRASRSTSLRSPRESTSGRGAAAPDGCGSPQDPNSGNAPSGFMYALWDDW
jgi:hypothetical protein